MKKKLIFIVCLFIISFQTFAQRKIKQMDSEKQEQEEVAKKYEKSPWREKVKFGGAASMMFGSSYSFFFVQPLAGYQVNDNFIAGGGITYTYWSQTYYGFQNQKYEYSDNAYGLNFFARHRIAGNVCAHAEYMPMNFNSYNGYGDQKRMWSHSLYVGGAIQQDPVYILILYDVLWHDYDNSDPLKYATSYRASPLDIRVGFMF